MSKISYLALILVECWPEEAGGQHGPIPPPSLLHARVCTADQSRFTAIPCSYCTGTDSADVWQQEHDGCLWSQAWPLSHRSSSVPRQDVHEGSGWTNVERPEQEQVCGEEPSLSRNSYAFPRILLKTCEQHRILRNSHYIHRIFFLFFFGEGGEGGRIFHVTIKLHWFPNKAL